MVPDDAWVPSAQLLLITRLVKVLYFVNRSPAWLYIFTGSVYTVVF